MLTSKKVELLEHDRLTTQLRRLERTCLRSGLEKVDHGPNGSDDVANAVAGCIVVAYNGLGSSLDVMADMNREYPPSRTVDPRRSWLDQGDGRISEQWDNGMLARKQLW